MIGYRINRPKRRNPPCDAPLCVVSSFFPWEKRREGEQRKVDFFSWVCLYEKPRIIPLSVAP